jgi:hypothetical protein
MREREPQGQSVRVDPLAESANPSLPAFIAIPKGAPVYHGFPLLAHSEKEGFSALEDLSYMGLTAATMFPGLDGVSKMMRHQMSFKDYSPPALPKLQ